VKSDPHVAPRTIDPLAVLLPSRIYQKLIEKWHPHVPSTAEMAEIVKTMSDQERTETLQNARTYAVYAKVVEAAAEKAH